MKLYRLENSPIVYYVSSTEHKEWTLFLHAAFVNHNMFKAQVDYFKDKYNVMALDLIGHGNSTDTEKGDSIAKMSEYIYEILKKENISEIHLVGISLGAVLAQDFANKYPDSVKSLACFGGYDINNFDKKLQKGNNAEQMRMMLEALFSVKRFAKSNKKISAYTESAQTEFYNMNIEFPKKSFRYLASLNSMINTRHTAPRAYPLLIGCGQHDIPSEISAVQMWKQDEPTAQIVIFENAGHCVNMDVPEQFNKALEEFWKSGNCK